MSPLIIIPFVLVLLVGFLVLLSYNKLVKYRQRHRNGFAQIDVQLKRRHDLIPNLIEVAKTYMSHERETLEAVIAARNQAAGARQSASSGGSRSELAGAEAKLSGAMGGFFGLMESYPDLKSNQNMMQLSEELTSTENKIAFARQSYNDAVTTYNTARETFPSVLIANSFGFQEEYLWEVEDASVRESVDVKF